jgi:endonuclease G
MIAPLRINGSYLHYEHFSVVVHKLRRLAIFTASNVDGTPQSRKPEVRPKEDYTRDGLGGLTKNDTEQWVADPRIDPKYILPDIFYKKDRQAFDKGHIVRREDVCFGSSYEQIRRANGDTYHVTNCSPQVSGYNQAPSATSGGLWGRLEHHVLTFVKAQKDRYCLFAGPVLKDTDREFEGVDDAGATRAKIPQRFWKVVCALKNGKLQVFAFILKQVLSGVKFEDEVFEPPIGWEEERITLKDLEKETGLLKFPKVYHDADQGTGA